MSKIYVDEMPSTVSECPFFNFMKPYGVCLAHGGVCECEYNGGTDEIYRCDWLTELPKGDKDNGSSEDK